MASTFPPPPPYYKLYKDYDKDPASAPPPPPPGDGQYTLFGADYSTQLVLPRLEEQGISQVYKAGPNADLKLELKGLNREVLLQFMDLINNLVQQPSDFARKVEDIGVLFKNIHHLLNSLRPHQARATVIHYLEAQLEQRKLAVEDIRRKREEAKALIKAAGCDLRETLLDSPEETMEMEGNKNAIRK